MVTASANRPADLLAQAPTLPSVDAPIADPPATTSLASESGLREPDAGVTARAAIDLAATEREERVLIDGARNALRNDHPAEALTVLARHARTFPQGVFQEERESLRREARRAQVQTDGGKPREIR